MKKTLFFIIALFALALSFTACGKKEQEHTCTPATDAERAATCTEEGLTGGSHCSECGKVITAQTKIPATGHAYTAEVIEATCSAEGYTKNTCSKCGDTYNDSIKAKAAHRFADGGVCLGCGTAAPTGTIEPDTAWYSTTKMAFTLTTKEELAGLASLVNSGTAFNGKTIYLGANIDLEYLDWTPIGNAQYPFAATFDGKGYTISNLRIGSDISYAGLFGKASGEISNFTIDNATVFVKGVQNYAAIVCGYTTSDLRSITVDGFVDAKLSNNVGGVVGYSTGELISISSDTDVSGGAYVGGILGFAKVSSTHFKELKNFGTVTVNGIGNVGGIVGKIESNGTLYIENCENHAPIVGKDYTGGLFGAYVSSSSFSMEGCNNYAAVTGNEYTGGVFGYFKRQSAEDISTIKNFGNTGKINGFGNVGGIFGYYWCVGTSNITGLKNDAEIFGNNQYVGGISGYADFVGAVLTDFTNNGKISGNNHTGGIIGYIELCEWDLDIINFQNHADVSGITKVGGLMGYFSSRGTPTITKCENTGNITGTDFVGGIAGHGSTYELVISELASYGTVKGTTEYIAGFVGYLHTNGYKLTVENSRSECDISGTSWVGGMFGYVNGRNDSIITGCEVKSNITAQYIAGGIAAETINVTISECSNAGSTIEANGTRVSGSTYEVYVGGYVGSGYRVEKCINDVTINHTNRGMYVGGIAGYLKHSVSECTNNAKISGFDYVGGIAGWVSSPYADVSTALINTGDISGNNWVGGLIGKCAYGNTYNLSDSENSGNITGRSEVGGIMGTLARTSSYNLTVMGVKNTGNVTGSDGYVGGLFGYIHGYGVNSIIDDCSSSANVSGLHSVGGLIGKAPDVTLKNSTNAGSTVTATGFIVESGVNRAYLGGYVGFGGAVDNLINDTEINFDQIAEFVGGIAGWLNYSASNCTNNADVHGYNYVGGIVGWLRSPFADATTGLTNTGDISGNDYVGGIYGKCEYRNTYTLTDSENSGNISGNAYVGGIMGNLSRYGNYNFSISGLKNTGDVTGTNAYVGGIFGYAYGYGANSIIEDSSSSADIVGLYIVGGLIGRAINMMLKNSTNAGSTVTATGFLKESTNNVYLGGYIGHGGLVEGLVNDVDINYELDANCVGGIIGFIPDDDVSYSIINCTNNGDITSLGDGVGGICGYYYEHCGGATHEMLASLTNTGKITGDTYVGGIIGRFRAEGSTVKYISTEFTNLGEISGTSLVGEICGSYYTTGASTLTGCTVLGHVTVNGEVVENQDLGENKNLTISERKIYGAEDETPAE